VPKRQQLLSELQAEKDYGIFLAIQVGGAPNELQLFAETAQYDDQAQGLRPRNQYIIRALGVFEHRVSVGVFARLAFLDDHPLLYHHNTPKVEVYFEGTPQDVNELVLDISQAHASTFGPLRHLAADINRGKPLVDLLRSGSGLLGEMPKPLAERMARVLAHHQLKYTLIEDDEFQTQDEHGRSRLARLLAIDDSYLIALDFSVEQMGKTP
jgi:hypothetical protein